MEAERRGGQLDLCRVATTEGWSSFEPVYEFERTWSEAQDQDCRCLIIVDWNRINPNVNWPERTFEFTSKASPLNVINDLSFQHPEVYFGCEVAIVDEGGFTSHVFEGASWDGKWIPPMKAEW